MKNPDLHELLQNLTTILDRPIAFHRGLIPIAGSVTAALMLSQAIYWAKRTTDGDGWFWKTQQEWFEECGLSRKEQESARARLRKTTFWHEVKRGQQGRIYFRVDLIKLLESLASPDEHLEMPKRDISRCPKGTSPDARKGHLQMPERDISDNILQRIPTETITETTNNNPDACASEKPPLAEKEPKPEPAKNPDESVEQKNVPPVVCEVTNELQKPVPKRDIYFDKRQWEPYREMFNEHKPHIWAKVNCLTEPRISALQSLYRDYGDELLLTFKEALDAAKLEKWTNTRSISFEGFCKLIPALSEKNQVLRGQRSEKVEQIAEQARTIEGAFAPRDDDYPVLHLVRTW